MRRLILLLLPILPLTAFALDLQDHPPEPKEELVRFMAKAGTINMSATQMAELAQYRASNPEIRKFAQQQLDDLPRNEVRLERVAAERNVHLPTTIYSVDPDLSDKLSRLTGREFEVLYIDTTLDQFKQATELYEAELKKNEDAGVQSFINETLPSLRQHVEWAEKQKTALQENRPKPH